MLSDYLGEAVVDLTTEHEIAQKCADREYSVLPPFGSHCRAETMVDATLTRDEHIYFESDSLTEAI